MEVSAWKGATYGIRIGHKNVPKYFDQTWDKIKVEIDGQFYSFNLSSSFWRSCPEIRGVIIPQWLREQGLIPWPKGKPPKFQLEPLGENKFRLHRAVK